MDRIEELLKKFNENDAMAAYNEEYLNSNEEYYCDGDPFEFAKALSKGFWELRKEQNAIIKELRVLGVLTKTICPLNSKWFNGTNERPE